MQSSLALLVAIVATATAKVDVSSALREAIDAGTNGEPSVSFDLAKIHRAFPDAVGSSLAERTAQKTGSPGALLDIAFFGAKDGEHSRAQQALQEWLFGRCRRLPESGSTNGLRRECTKRVASFAAAIQRHGPASTPDTLRHEAVIALGIDRRSAFTESTASESDAAADVQQASQAARADSELQELLRRPGVQSAMERIAANPSAIADEQDPDVLEALNRLNALLKG